MCTFFCFVRCFGLRAEPAGVLNHSVQTTDFAAIFFSGRQKNDGVWLPCSPWKWCRCRTSAIDRRFCVLFCDLALRMCLYCCKFKRKHFRPNWSFCKPIICHSFRTLGSRGLRFSYLCITRYWLPPFRYCFFRSKTVTHWLRQNCTFGSKPASWWANGTCKRMAKWPLVTHLGRQHLYTLNLPQAASVQLWKMKDLHQPSRSVAAIFQSVILFPRRNATSGMAPQVFQHSGVSKLNPLIPTDWQASNVRTAIAVVNSSATMS